MKNPIYFIGGGNMAASLIGGLLAKNPDFAQKIHVIEPNFDRQIILKNLFKNINILNKLENNLCEKSVVILAVKPQIMPMVCRDLSQFINKNSLIISIAAGIKIVDLARWLNHKNLVRTMPNTPALLQCGITGIYAHASVKAEARDLANAILLATGETVWVQTEQDIDAVTAVSGSGPAYFFLLMEAMQAAGEKLGLSSDLAQKLTLHTALGAAKMALHNAPETPPSTLRTQVTSPNGTTHAALTVFAENNFEKLVFDALKAAQTRAEVLANQYAAL